MVVLVVHNRYRQRGGEDVTAEAETKLLRRYGHSVDLFEVDNAVISGIAGTLKAGLSTVYSAVSKASLAARIAALRPDVVHVHNFFPLLSPSIYYACSEAGVPVVQTLQNYVLICPGGKLLRGGRPCEDCVGSRIPWRGVLHGCYRNSRAGSLALASMVTVHRFLKTWDEKVDVYIAVTDFSRNKLIEGGLPAQKLVVKPNFAPDPGAPRDYRRDGPALFVGRLSPEKGIATLLSAWDRLSGAIPLKVVGDGPLRDEVVRYARAGRCEYLGMLPREQVQGLMREARLLVFPSIWYECLPLVIMEAFSAGLPVIASNLGSMSTVIRHGDTGFHFRPGDPEDLAAKVEWAVRHPEEMARMGRQARAEYLAKYTPERNYEILMGIYRQVIEQKAAS